MQTITVRAGDWGLGVGGWGSGQIGNCGGHWAGSAEPDTYRHMEGRYVGHSNGRRGLGRFGTVGGYCAGSTEPLTDRLMRCRCVAQRAMRGVPGLA